MHKFMLKGFGALKSFWQFMKIFWVFSILILLLYWIQNLTSAEWGWMGFVKPYMEALLFMGNKILSSSFFLFDVEVELKYVGAILILLALFYLMNLFIMITNLNEEVYIKTRSAYKKAEEANMNKQLQKAVSQEEKRIKKFNVTIQTALKTKFNTNVPNVNLEEQNKIMNKYLIGKFGISPSVFGDAFMYSFSDFDKVDEVLDVLLGLLNSQAPVKYSICLQVGDDIKLLKKLVELKHFNKITMAADTAFRYTFNEEQKYKTAQVGLFQYEDHTIEVHEFLEKYIV